MNKDTGRLAVRALTKKKLTVAIAESCTGGLVGHLLTETPGSSAVFKGSVVAYSDDVKKQLLAVKAGTLKAKGTVSRQVALEMAEGVRRRLGADIGIAVTGTAGPSGGTKKKPVGTVYIAFAKKGRTICRKYDFGSKVTRTAVKKAAAEAALLGIEKFVG